MTWSAKAKSPTLIPGGEGHVDEQQGGVDGVVQLGQGPRPHPHEPAMVEADDDRLGTLGDQLGCHQPPGARSCLPVDAALGIVGDRLPDPLELGALPRPPLGAHPQLGELAAPGQGLVDADGRRDRRRSGPSPPRRPRTGAVRGARVPGSGSRWRRTSPRRAPPGSPCSAGCRAAQGGPPAPPPRAGVGIRRGPRRGGAAEGGDALRYERSPNSAGRRRGSRRAPGSR